MKAYMLQTFKKILTLIGARVPASKVHRLQLAINYMKLGRWMVDNQFQVSARLDDRSSVFQEVANKVHEKKVLYLEFGVHTGASMRFWSKALTNNESQLHGFDRFEGLPEDFDDVGGLYRKGTFDVGGKLPNITDSRVTFFKGWFEETLPKYSLPDHDVLVITIDADLYSATIFVLEQLREHIRPGTFIYFDEMNRPEHEPRAFREFMEETRLKFKLVATDRSLNTSFFECIN
jgi:hypothetical protein